MAALIDLDRLISRTGLVSLAVTTISYSFSAGKISVFGPRLQSFFSFADLAFNFSALSRTIVTILSVVLVVQVLGVVAQLLPQAASARAAAARLHGRLFGLAGLLVGAALMTAVVWAVWRPFIANEYDDEYRLMFSVLLPCFALALWHAAGRFLKGDADVYVTLVLLAPAILVLSYYIGRFESIAQVACFEKDGIADRHYYVGDYSDAGWRYDGEEYKIIIATPHRAIFFRRLPSRRAFVRLWDFGADRALTRYLITDGPLNTRPCLATS